MRLRPKPTNRSRAVARVSGAASDPPPSMPRGGYGRRKVRPNLGADREGTRLLNLTVLRRLDPAVADIIITAAHVTAYSFDEDTVQWSRKGVEGSLFVVKRNTQPRFQFVIMNRRNTENLVEDLLSNFRYQVQVPYIIYSNGADEILGIWFYDPEECKELARLFSRIHNAYSRSSPREMVSAAKSDFEELEVASSVHSAEDTVEQPTSSSMVLNDVGYKLSSAMLTEAACVGAPRGGASPVEPNQFIRAVPSSRHSSPSAISSQPPALHNVPPSRTSSATVVPADAHVSTSTPTIQPANLTNPLLFPHIPILFSQTTIADAAFASSAPPPLHPPLAIQQRQSAPLHQLFPLSSAPPLHPQHQQSVPLIQLFAKSTAPPPLHARHQQSDSLLQPFPQSTAPPPLHPRHQQSDSLLQPFPQSTAPPPLHPQHRQSGPLLHPFPQSTALPPPYGSPLLQPFPPPNPSPLLAQTVSHVPVLSRDKVRDVMLKLVQNEDFIDTIYWEIVKAQR
uniref:Uncharacterized protein n=1 Tax=Avena sativa TaxID=4498 RepID=A0ACD5XAZ2_AVESA